MNKQDFLHKWKEFIEEQNFEISNTEALDFLDEQFEIFSTNSNFYCDALKYKFNSIRFYASGVSPEEKDFIEKSLKLIL